MVLSIRITADSRPDKRLHSSHGQAASVAKARPLSSVAASVLNPGIFRRMKTSRVSGQIAELDWTPCPRFLASCNNNRAGPLERPQSTDTLLVSEAINNSTERESELSPDNYQVSNGPRTTRFSNQFGLIKPVMRQPDRSLGAVD